MKIISFFINAIYWLGLFIVPALIGCFCAYWLYAGKTAPLFLSVIAGLCGVIAGTVIAEYIRRRFGLNNFWSGISSNLTHVKDYDEGNNKL